MKNLFKKFLWRAYWKGWLELRPNVWTDYLIELEKIRKNLKIHSNYKNAIEGKQI